MKALIISPRFPWPAYTGDRLRATIWLSALSENADVAMVAPRGRVPDRAPRFHFYAAKRSIARCLTRAKTLILESLPLQCLLVAPYDWSEAIDRARKEVGPFDVTIVLLSRMHPWLRDELNGRTLLDAVDSLRRNAHERQRAARPALRWMWRMEERRMARLELDAARTYGRVVVVSEDERVDFDRAVAVTNGIFTEPLVSEPRAFDFGFWGRFPYFANADAVTWLLDEIWPAIRALHPAATLALGGAEASGSIRRAAKRAGVTLVSPVDAMGSFARDIRVAILPLRYGSGESSKVLEAAEGGCAVVATPLALRGFTPLLLYARVESSASALAQAAVDLLDESRRAPLAGCLRKAAETHYARSATLERLRTIAASAEGS